MLLLISTSDLINFDYTSSSSSVEFNFFMSQIAVFISISFRLRATWALSGKDSFRKSSHNTMQYRQYS